MWRSSAILILFLAGCNTADILTKDPRGLDEGEKAILITELWKRCQEGVIEGNGAPKDEHERRIKVFEEAKPYGERAFEIAPFTSHQAALWSARCLTFLGWDYEVWGQKLRQRGKTEGDQSLVEQGDAHRAAARGYMIQALKRMLHYERVYNDTNPDELLPHSLEVTYELLGDYRSAYIVARNELRRLQAVKKSVGLDPVLDSLIQDWRNRLNKLAKLLRDRGEPVPDEPESAPRVR